MIVNAATSVANQPFSAVTSVLATSASLRGNVNRRLTFIYLCLALPVTALLCFLIGPWEGADEPAHFYRAAAVATGSMLPVIDRVDGRLTAGAALDRSLANTTPSWSQLTDQTRRMNIASLRQLSTHHQLHTDAYTAHSNTAIYPPVFYAAPAVAIAVARQLDVPILAWLYGGRRLSGLVAVLIIAASLRLSGEYVLPLFAIALNPIILFQLATISADAALFPIVFAFAVSLTRCVNFGQNGRWAVAVLALSSAALIIGKVAYLPLALIAAVAAVRAPSLSHRQRWSIVTAILAALTAWLIWSFLVRHAVFSIRPNVHVDPIEQLRVILAEPLAAIMIFVRAMTDQLISILLMAFGSRLGWTDLLLPKGFIALNVVCFILFASVAYAPSTRSRPTLFWALLLSIVTYVFVYLLIYLQYNAVGATQIEGVQGRYITPVFIVIAVLVGRKSVTKKTFMRVEILAIVLAVMNVVVTLSTVTTRYWQI